MSIPFVSSESILVIPVKVKETVAELIRYLLLVVYVVCNPDCARLTIEIGRTGKSS